MKSKWSKWLIHFWPFFFDGTEESRATKHKGGVKQAPAAVPAAVVVEAAPAPAAAAAAASDDDEDVDIFGFGISSTYLHTNSHRF